MPFVGVITVLQSVLLLRLLIVQGPYAGSFGSLLAVDHVAGGLGAAYGSLFVAALIWCVVTIPISCFSVIGLFSRFLRALIIAGMIVTFIMIQVANVALPDWIGQPQSPEFPIVNILSGVLAVAVIIVVSLWGGAAILIGLTAGTIGHAIFRPVSLAAVANAPWLVTPRIFPFGFALLLDLIIIFLLVLLPVALGGCVKFGLMLVVVPLPVISEAATLLFGIVLMHGVQILAKVDWDDHKFIVSGLAMLVTVGGLFLSPEVLAQVPLPAKLMITQPVISGSLALVVLQRYCVVRHRQMLNRGDPPSDARAV